MNAKNRSEGKFDNKDKTAFYAGRDAWLKTVECRESNRIHMLKLHELGKVSAPSKEALGKAAEWHSSADGLKWHSDNGVASWKNRKPTEKICEVCLSTYTTFYPNRSKFCGNNCKATALRRRRKE